MLYLNVMLFIFILLCSLNPYLSRLRLVWDALVEEPFEMGVGISPFSDGLRPSFTDIGRGPGPDGS